MHSLIRKDGLIGNPGDELLAVRKVEFPEKEKVVLEIPDSVSRLGISFRERKRYGKRKICSHTVFEYCTRCSPWWLKNTFEGEDLKALLRVMASYITEGSVTPHSGIYYTNITQKERGYLDDVANAMKQIGDIPLTIYRNGNLWVLESNHSLLAKTLLKYSGRYSKGKKIPSFVFSLPREYREFFWNELLKGDGTKRKKWNSYYTVSKKLAAGVSLLLSTLGIDYNFNISDSFGKYSSKGYMIQEISFHSPRCKVKVQEAEPTPYLYDLQTETGSFTDGIGLVGLHNSYYYGKRTWKRIPLRRKE